MTSTLAKPALNEGRELLHEMIAVLHEVLIYIYIFFHPQRASLTFS